MYVSIAANLSRVINTVGATPLLGPHPAPATHYYADKNPFQHEATQNTTDSVRNPLLGFTFFVSSCRKKIWRCALCYAEVLAGSQDSHDPFGRFAVPEFGDLGLLPIATKDLSGRLQNPVRIGSH